MLMNKKTMIILLLITSSILLIFQVKAEPKTQNFPTKLNLIFQSASNLNRDEVFVQFNRSVLEDNTIFTAGEIINFSVELDVADVALLDNEPSQLDNWFFDEPDDFGRYTETRMLGSFNIFLDDTDLGIYQSIYWWNRIQELDVDLEEGWHWLTIFAAEYCSDQTRSSLSWKWSKDQVRFYVCETEPETLPEIESVNNECQVKAMPVEHKELLVYQNDPFTWTYDNIFPRVEISGDQATSLEQILLRRRDDAYLEVIFNASDTELALIEDEGRATFADVNQMGYCTYYWWVNDGQPLNELEGTFNLNGGYNFVIFIVAGFSSVYDWYADGYIPVIKFATKTVVVITDYLITPFDFISAIFSVIILTSLTYIFNRIRKNKRDYFR